MSEFQVFDVQQLAQADAGLKEDLCEVVAKTGFFYINNHGISQREIDEMFKLMRELVYMDKRNEIPGVLTYGSSPSLEFFMLVFNPRRGQERVLPNFLKKKQDILESFENKCAEAGRLVLEGLVAALGINSFYTLLVSKLHTSHLQLIKCGPKKSRSVRMDGHFDAGAITLLMHESPVYSISGDFSGLQVDTSSTYGTWKDAYIKPGCIMVNIGKDFKNAYPAKAKACYHRVAAPKDYYKGFDRLSLGYFI